MTEFFHDEVKDALREQHVEAAPSTEFYLVNLLAEYASSPVDPAPLAIKMGQAASAATEERLRTLKEVGDTSLYMSGFFAEAITHKSVNVNYYVCMGGSAYAQLAGMVSRGGSALRDVYGELADKFGSFVDVLGVIRARSNIAANANVLRMAEEWLRTRDEGLEKRLRAAGLLVGGGGDGIQ
jgi:hypothetical protein